MAESSALFADGQDDRPAYSDFFTDGRVLVQDVARNVIWNFRRIIIVYQKPKVFKLGCCSLLGHPLDVRHIYKGLTLADLQGYGLSRRDLFAGRRGLADDSTYFKRTVDLFYLWHQAKSFQEPYGLIFAIASEIGH
ncbi:MAG: hypothetical protein QMD53_02010 [Actinomycetota bacterium]|nr:hypothetical protein [Actinomycetota bacterium]